MSAPEDAACGMVSVHEAAKEFIRAGLSVIPIRGDGSKKPNLPTWKEYQERVPSPEEGDSWFADRKDVGLALVCGRGVEVLDFDDPDVFEPWKLVVEEAEPGLLETLPLVATPSGGRHLYYRCTDVGRNAKLAKSADGDTLIETRAEGGYVVAPPSPPYCHPDHKAYVHISGPLPWAIPSITPEQRHVLSEAARSFTRKPAVVVTDPNRKTTDRKRPGDVFNEEATWEQVLEPAGWVAARRQDEVTYWRRPGGTAPGHSATTGACGDLFFCFTSNGQPFETDKAYTKFTAFALLNYGGDFPAAARAVLAMGYGEGGPTNEVAPARAAVPEVQAPDRPNEAADDPHRLARLYVTQRCTHPEGAVTLRFWRKEWHRWDGTAYRQVPDDEVRAELANAIKEEFDRVNLEELRTYQERVHRKDVARGEQPPTTRKVTKGVVANVFQALAGMTVVSAKTEQPAWLDGEAAFPADEILAAQNGLIHLPSFAQGTGQVAPPNPRFFSANALRYDFDPQAPEPRQWLAFLGELWPDDPESVSALQEWFGYCLLPDTRQQKMLLVVGPPRSGKGTLATVLEEVVGRDNVTGPTLSSLATPFGLACLLGSTLAVIADARLGGRTDAAVIIERLLAISGEDTLSVDRKFLAAVEVKLRVRFVILTNELPRLTDSSGALARRMLVLRLTRTWFNKEDPKLKGRLLGELAGILLWAVKGWERLRTRGYFVQSAAGKEMVAQLEELTSPTWAFVRDYCEVGDNCSVAKKELFDKWRAWCEVEGRERPGDMSMFGRNLLATVPGITASQPRGEDKSRVPTYLGIGLRGR